MRYWLGEEVSVTSTKNDERYSLRNKHSSKGQIFRKYIGSSKTNAIVDLCRKIIDGNDTDKVVVYSQWAGFLDLVEYFLKERGYKSFRYDGDIVDFKKRSSVITNFNAVDSERIILCTLQCGGVGLNLVAANHVILADGWYNPFLEEQAINRVHRIGQTKDVYVYRLITKKSIEMDIYKRQQRKKSVAYDIFSSIFRREDGPGSKKSTDLEDGSTIRDRHTGLTEMDVHDIFKRAANTFRIIKTSPKRAVYSDTLTETNKECGTILVEKKRKRSVVDIFVDQRPDKVKKD
jgi:SNF2 family DNA or RNA helicase